MSRSASLALKRWANHGLSSAPQPPHGRSRLVRIGLASLLSLSAGQLAWTEPAAQAAASDESALIEAGEATIHALIEGEGQPIVLLPALGRGVADFSDLSARLVTAGFQVVRPQPRGIGASTGPTTGLTLHDLGNDIAAVIRALDNGPVTLVGHAFGSRVARVVASDHPQLVSALVLLAAEERQPAPPDILHARLMSYDPSLSRRVRRRLIQKAFFAAGNDPVSWQSGWHQKATRTQMVAILATKTQAWTAPGSTPILLLQGTEDKIAPPENARRFKRHYGARVTLVEIRQAGHAMLPEQPRAIAKAIVSFLRP